MACTRADLTSPPKYDLCQRQKSVHAAELTALIRAGQLVMGKKLTGTLVVEMILGKSMVLECFGYNKGF